MNSAGILDQNHGGNVSTCDDEVLSKLRRISQEIQRLASRIPSASSPANGNESHGPNGAIDPAFVTYGQEEFQHIMHHIERCISNMTTLQANFRRAQLRRTLQEPSSLTVPSESVFPYALPPVLFAEDPTENISLRADEFILYGFGLNGVILFEMDTIQMSETPLNVNNMKF
jgi:hypothetical protein